MRDTNSGEYGCLKLCLIGFVEWHENTLSSTVPIIRDRSYEGLPSVDLKVHIQQKGSASAELDSLAFGDDALDCAHVYTFPRVFVSVISPDLHACMRILIRHRRCVRVRRG